MPRFDITCSNFCAKDNDNNDDTTDYMYFTSLHIYVRTGYIIESVDSISRDGTDTPYM